MITVYKIGESLYNNVDKNSGLYEYNLIKNALKGLSTNKKVLVIINGKITKNDYCLDSMLNKYELKIFIASDIVALTLNKHIIDKCDILLHQSTNEIEGINIRQRYSFVPELFYNNGIINEQDNKLFFGGGVRDKEQRIKQYLNNCNSASLLKTDSEDNRLPYNEYIKELSKHKFALIISRKPYDELGWVTSRFVEAISNWVYPIVDEKYDKYNHYLVNKVNINNYNKVIESLIDDELFRFNVIRSYREKFYNDSFKFKQLMEELINE
jgi:hypothetical protein